MLDVAAIGRDDRCASPDGGLDDGGVDRTGRVGDRAAKRPGALGLVGLSLSLLCLVTLRRRLAQLRARHVGWAMKLSVLAYSWPLFGVLVIVGLAQSM